MTAILPYRRDRSDYLPVVAAGGMLAIMVAWLLFGTTGLFAWNDYNHALAAKRVELAQLRAQQLRLENRVRLLDPRHVDPDLVDELARRELNVLHPDEIVIPLK